MQHFRIIDFKCICVCVWVCLFFWRAHIIWTHKFPLAIVFFFRACFSLHNDFFSPFDPFEVAIAIILAIRFTSSSSSSSSKFIKIKSQSNLKFRQKHARASRLWSHIVGFFLCLSVRCTYCVRNFKFKFESYDRSHQRAHRFSSSSFSRVCVCVNCAYRNLSFSFCSYVFASHCFSFSNPMK